MSRAAWRRKMRGKVWLAVGLLILIIGLGIGEQAYISSTFNKAVQKSEEITALIRAENYEGAQAATNALSDWWKKERDVLEFLCPNNDVKGIMTAIGDLQGALSAQMYDDSLQRSISLTCSVENSKNLLSFKWKNVL